jgi:hypothetical protein
MDTGETQLKAANPFTKQAPESSCGLPKCSNVRNLASHTQH